MIYKLESSISEKLMYSKLIRLYIYNALSKNTTITLASNQYHYLKNVMRVNKNEFLKLFNGKDGEWLAEIIDIQKKYILLSIKEKIIKQKNSPNLWLFFAPIKKDRINILIQKSTELGVSVFVPIQSERSNVKNININNLQKNAIEAAEQSQRLDVPIIKKEIKFSEMINSLSSDRCLLFCDEKNINSENIIDLMDKIKNKYSKWSIIVGPEGGFSENERKKLLNIKQVHTASLGERILRSDTAATAALFCVQKFIEK